MQKKRKKKKGLVVSFTINSLHSKTNSALTLIWEQNMYDTQDKHWGSKTTSMYSCEVLKYDGVKITFIWNLPVNLIHELVEVTNVCVVVSLDVTNIYTEMDSLEKLVKTATDILDCRIEAVLNDMSITALCDLPEEEAITAEKFLELTTNIVNQASEQLATWVYHVHPTVFAHLAWSPLASHLFFMLAAV